MLHPELWEIALGPTGCVCPGPGQGVKRIGSLDPGALRGSHGNLVVLLWLCPLSLPSPRFISKVTVERCQRVLRRGKMLTGGGVYSHVLTPFCWNMNFPGQGFSADSLEPGRVSALTASSLRSSHVVSECVTA